MALTTPDDFTCTGQHRNNRPHDQGIMSLQVPDMEFGLRTGITKDPFSFLEALVRRLTTGATSLDIGCGSGRDMCWFRERGFKPAGLERSSALAELAPYWNDPFFRSLVADRVRFVLTRYFSRKAQVAEIPYTHDNLNSGFSVPRDFALTFFAENPLKPGESRKIKLKVNGKRYDALFQRPGFVREYRIVYDQESEAAHALSKYLVGNIKPGHALFTLPTSGKNELLVERFRDHQNR